ncbi:chorismate-binding protein [Jiangella asiatica]|uniref:Anthranilate synthase component I family protein n=1 Tax=Jiangella asiatica TaxID=2530372 RepID=A0A4R5D9B7_9ACTN|nr:anthranilate synthase component I family protein [Jiangella asiatica]
MLATGLSQISDDLRVLDRGGRWAVVVTFEGRITCARFDQWERVVLPRSERPWEGPAAGDWTSSLDRDGYVGAVRSVRELIAAGTVYQVNVCRVLAAELPALAEGLLPLANRLGDHHQAPFAGLIDVPGAQVVTASPELFLRRRGDLVTSSPIKGTGRIQSDLTAKDAAENVMIVDLVRNDLSRVCRTGSVVTDELLGVEPHPGLVHLVSTVSGRLLPGAGWPELFAAAFPPGSVSGAPKSSALAAIEALEPVPRGPYCGAVGWVDADTGEGELAVGIRTFWADGGVLRFGTGAGITWGSDPEREWAETELKAERLVGLASC